MFLCYNAFIRKVPSWTMKRFCNTASPSRAHFYVVSLDGTVSGVDIIRMIDHAYESVVSRMPGYARRELREKAHEA